MARLMLNYVGEDHLGLPVYMDNKGFVLKDINCDQGSLALYSTGDGTVDGDPDKPIDKLKYFKPYFADGNFEVQFTNRPLRETPELQFAYMLLSRLQQDCNYYISVNGCRLWGITVKGHIDKMLELYSSLPFDKKPEWLGLNDINMYAKFMYEIEASKQQ